MAFGFTLNLTRLLRDGGRLSKAGTAPGAGGDGSPGPDSGPALTRAWAENAVEVISSE